MVGQAPWRQSERGSHGGGYKRLFVPSRFWIGQSAFLILTDFLVLGGRSTLYKMVCPRVYTLPYTRAARYNNYSQFRPVLVAESNNLTRGIHLLVGLLIVSYNLAVLTLQLTSAHRVLGYSLLPAFGKLANLLYEQTPFSTV